MRTFNVRLAAILVAVTVVFGIGVYVVHGIQVKRNAQAFLDQADEAEKRAKDAVKENDPWEEQKARRNVIKNLSWYVQLMPDKVDALERLGLMRAGQSYDPAGRWPPKDRRMFAQASDNLEKVLRQEPERKASRQELVKMMMFWHRFQDAKEHLQILLKESPKDADLLEQLGQCQAKTGGVDAAIETYKKAIHCGPGQLTAYEKLAGLLRSPGVAKPKEADQWMGDGPPAVKNGPPAVKGLVAANPKSAKAHYLRSRYLMDLGQGEEAVKEAMRALDLAPDDADVLLLASRCDLMRGEPEKARKLVDHGLKLHPANSDMYQIEAEVELRSGKPGDRVDRAVAALRRGLKATQQKVGTQQTAEATGHRIDLLETAAEDLINANRLDEVQETIAELRKTIDELRKANVRSEDINYLNAITDYLLARIEFAKENWRAARRPRRRSAPRSLPIRGWSCRSIS